MNGTRGFQMFNEVIAKMETCKRVFSKTQKLQLAAIRRAGYKQDLLGDWKPLIERAFSVWGV